MLTSKYFIPLENSQLKPIQIHKCLFDGDWGLVSIRSERDREISQLEQILAYYKCFS